MSVRIVEKGTCERCRTECTREPGGRWYNFFGRDECRLDPDEGPHVVPVWHQAEVEQSAPVPAAEVVLYGLDAEGRTVEVLRQSLPALDGAWYQEDLPGPLEVTGLRFGIGKGSGGL